jgi:hypothetical protein
VCKVYRLGFSNALFAIPPPISAASVASATSGSRGAKKAVPSVAIEKISASPNTRPIAIIDFDSVPI